MEEIKFLYLYEYDILKFVHQLYTSVILIAKEWNIGFIELFLECEWWRYHILIV